MKTEEQTYWQIQDFLKGRLDNNEREAFQKLVEQDAGLAEEVEKHRLANRLIIQNRLMAAQQTAIKTKADYKRNLLHRKLYQFGAVLLIAVGSGSYLWYANSGTISEPIALQKPSTTIMEAKQEATSTVMEKRETNVDRPAISQVPKQKSISKEFPTQPLEEQTVPKEEPIAQVSEPTATVVPVETKSLELPVPHKEVTKAAENACSSTHLQASVFASPSCKGEHAGSIVVSRIKGGKSPYRTEIRSEKGILIEEANGLPKGIYTVVLFDDQHCSARIDHVEVKEKMCELEEKVFNPFLDETFELPNSSKNGTFVVYEKNGNVYYKKEFVAHEKEEWKGISNNGEMETGHFTYELIYQDGSRKQGTLTITR